MTRRPIGKGPAFAHAARVALVATLLIGVVYVAVVVVFDILDAEHLVGQVDANLRLRIADATHQRTIVPTRSDADDDHDVDSAPIFVWQVRPNHDIVALSDGAPPLGDRDWPRSSGPVTTTLGSNSFRLIAVAVDGGWLVAGQSLVDPIRVGHVLLEVEGIAAPCLLLATYLGTLVIGIKASGPVEQSRRRQLEFTADASHELRTPLSVIEAEVGLALRTRQDAGQNRDTLQRIAGESERLRRIVEDLLWLARFDSNPPSPSDEPVDLFVIAEGCADRFAAVAQAQNITLTVEHRGDVEAWINAPPEWVDRLTAVLVDNACRHAGRDGVVRIVVGAEGGGVSVTVEDSGPGIPPGDRSHLFDRFHRATDVGTGAGLGLAIADSVVRSTGGQWHIGEADIGGARMTVAWIKSTARHPAPLVTNGERTTRSDVTAGGP
jgi:signal transduction histidine kinase